MAYCVLADIEKRLPGLLQIVTDEAVVRGSVANGTDTLAHENVKSIDYVNSTSGKGPDAPTYAVTTDYTLHTSSKKVDWAPTGGSEPAAGATYYVSYKYYVLAGADVTELIDEAADAVINARLADRYDVPFSTAPLLVARVSQDLSTYYVGLDLFAFQGREVPMWLSDRYDRAMALLDRVATGQMTLIDSSGNIVSESAGRLTVESTKESYEPVFEMDGILDHVVDDDWLDHMLTERD